MVRRARTADVRDIRRLIDMYSADRRLLSKATVAIYEDVQEFWVADVDGTVVGCGAVHVLWEDLPRSVRSRWTRPGAGARLVTRS
jgi:amino-acid N-acetyltransferase